MESEAKAVFFLGSRGVFASWFKAKSLEDASDDATEALKLSGKGGFPGPHFVPPPKKTGHLLWPQIIWESLGLMEFGRWFETNVVYVFLLSF